MIYYKQIAVLIKLIEDGIDINIIPKELIEEMILTSKKYEYALSIGDKVSAKMYKTRLDDMIETAIKIQNDLLYEKECIFDEKEDIHHNRLLIILVILILILLCAFVIIASMKF